MTVLTVGDDNLPLLTGGDPRFGGLEQSERAECRREQSEQLRGLLGERVGPVDRVNGVGATDPLQLYVAGIAEHDIAPG